MYLWLDRALVTQKWIDKFRDIRVYHLVKTTSDHYALLITDSFAPQSPWKRRFQFEAMWTRREDCRYVIKEAWTGSVRVNNPSDIMAGLKRCADELSRWNRTVFGHVPRQIQRRGMF